MDEKQKNDAMLRLLAVQTALKAPKNQYNSFGKYKYRNCEDILEAVKPLLKKHDLILRVSDSVKLIGERYYIEAHAAIYDARSDSRDFVVLECAGFARESDDKKGMDASQVTGAASSYARKYALNGLFLIDDTKDADSDESTAKAQAKTPAKTQASAPKGDSTAAERLHAVKIELRDAVLKWAELNGKTPDEALSHIESGQTIEYYESRLADFQKLINDKVN